MGGMACEVTAGRGAERASDRIQLATFPSAHSDASLDVLVGQTAPGYDAGGIGAEGTADFGLEPEPRDPLSVGIGNHDIYAAGLYDTQQPVQPLSGISDFDNLQFHKEHVDWGRLLGYYQEPSAMQDAFAPGDTSFAPFNFDPMLFADTHTPRTAAGSNSSSNAEAYVQFRSHAGDEMSRPSSPRAVEAKERWFSDDAPQSPNPAVLQDPQTFPRPCRGMVQPFPRARNPNYFLYQAGMVLADGGRWSTIL